MTKTLLTILGPGASGKSTLSRALLGPDAEDGVHLTADQRPIKTAVSRDGHTRLAGNLKNGSDSISQMEDLAAVLRYWSQLSHISLAITDGVRCSTKWNVDWARKESGYDRLVYAYMDLTLEENLARLRARRAANGVATELSEKTLANVQAFRRRAAGVWRAARAVKHQNDDERMALISVKGEMTPDDTLALVRNALHY